MTRKEAREYIIKHCNPHRDTGTQWDDAMECAIKALGEPERKTGKWIKCNNSCTIRCNQCGQEMTSLCDIQLPNYCLNCGSRMRGEEE